MTGSPGRLALLVAAVVAIWFAFVTGRSTLWDRDEPRYARATLEMVRSGDALVPTFNGRVRPDKPPLIYWLTSVPVRWFGTGERSVRAVAPIASAIACLLLFVVGRRLLSDQAGLTAATVMATTPLLLVSGTAVTTDALLLALVLGCFVFVARAVEHGRLSWTGAVGLGVLLGGVTLTKGPVGLAVVVLGVVGAWVFDRANAPVRGDGWLKLAVAVALGLALFLAWALPANQASGGVLAERGLGYHVVARTLRPLESHGGSLVAYLPYYVVVVALAFFPWTLYLPAGLVRVWRGHCVEARTRALLLGWLVPNFVMFSVVATKLPHYILPLWPALALVTGVAIADADGARLGGRPLAAGKALFLFGGGVLAVALIVGPWFAPLPGARRGLVGLGLLVVAALVVGLRSAGRGRHRLAVRQLAVAGLGIQAVLVFSVLPAVERIKLTHKVVEAVVQAVPADAPVAVWGYAEPSLVYYLDPHAVTPLDSTEDAARWLGGEGERALVVETDRLGRIAAAVSAAGVVEVARVSGLDAAHGRWREVALLVRR